MMETVKAKMWVLVVFVWCLSGLVESGQGEIDYIITDQVGGNTFIGNLVEDASLNRKYQAQVLQSLTFRFLTPPSAAFVIEKHTGILRTSGTIDRDTVCPRQNVCEVKLDVAVQPAQYFQIIKVSIEILDLNDNAPTFPEPHVTHQMLESASPGASFVIPNAIDDDSPQFGIRGYDIISNTRKFDLQVTEKVDGSTDVRLILKERLDREIESEYKVTVIAFDGGDPPQSGAVDITITVLDANDHDPKFEQKVYEVTVPEDVETNASILRVHAVDPDAGRNGRIVYSFSERTQSTYGNIFGIDSHSGDIFIKGEIDYETASVYHLAIVAEDKGPDSLPDDATVIVRVQDINDHAPEITVNTLSATGSDVAQIQEGSDIGTFVAHITVVDKDKGVNGDVGCSLNADNFELVKLYQTEYKIVTAEQLDREEQEEYEMVLLCEDKGEDKQVEIKTINIQVTDVNDHRPVFQTSEYHSQIIENNFVGAYVTQVNATDEDVGPNAKIEYSVPKDMSGLFNVDPKSGYVTAAKSFDREQIDHISFYVLATDHGEPPLTGSAMVHVVIQDVNDEKPEFSEDSYSFTVFENEPIGSEVGQVHALDLDDAPYNQFTYSIIRSRSDVDSFAIDPETGMITTRNVLNREELSLYFLVVLTQDSGNPPLTSTVNVNIQVADKNDWEPAFDYPTAYNNTVYISNQVPVGYHIANVQARDMDVGANAEIFYSIVEGNKDMMFDIDAFTGRVQVIGDFGPVDHEVYELKVEASDNGQPPLKADEMLYVSVNKTIGFAHAEAQPQWSLFGANSLTFIIVLAISSALITILLIIAIICIRRKDRRKHEHGKYNCRTEAMKMLNGTEHQDSVEIKDCEHKAMMANGGHKQYDGYGVEADYVESHLGHHTMTRSGSGSHQSWRSGVESPNQVTSALLPAGTDTGQHQPVPPNAVWQPQQPQNKDMEVHQLLEILKHDADTDSAYSEDGTDSGSGKQEQQHTSAAPDNRMATEQGPAFSYQKPAFSTFSPSNTYRRFEDPSSALRRTEGDPGPTYRCSDDPNGTIRRANDGKQLYRGAEDANGTIRRTNQNQNDPNSGTMRRVNDPGSPYPNDANNPNSGTMRRVTTNDPNSTYRRAEDPASAINANNHNNAHASPRIMAKHVSSAHASPRIIAKNVSSAHASPRILAKNINAAPIVTQAPHPGDDGQSHVDPKPRTTAASGTLDTSRSGSGSSTAESYVDGRELCEDIDGLFFYNKNKQLASPMRC